MKLQDQMHNFIADRVRGTWESLRHGRCDVIAAPRSIGELPDEGGSGIQTVNQPRPSVEDDPVSLHDSIHHIVATPRIDAPRFSQFHNRPYDALPLMGEQKPGQAFSALWPLLTKGIPSVQHQEYLRTHKPSGLQPVDEDVTEEDMQRLARDVGGELVHFTPKTVWADADYVHDSSARPLPHRTAYRNVTAQRLGTSEKREVVETASIAAVDSSRAARRGLRLSKLILHET